MKKEHEGRKIVSSAKIPKWFTQDIIEPYNRALINLGCSFQLKGITKAELALVQDHNMAKLPLNDVELLAEYFSLLSRTNWARFRIENKKYRNVKFLALDKDMKHIYELEQKDIFAGLTK